MCSMTGIGKKGIATALASLGFSEAASAALIGDRELRQIIELHVLVRGRAVPTKPKRARKLKETV